MDPLQDLQAAYSVPADSREQADLLDKLRENLEAHPIYIPVLCSSLIRGVPGAQDSLLKRWTVELLHYGISRANLPIEKRTELASQSLDILAGVLSDPNPSIVKTTVQCFGTIYPLMFRYLCTNRSQRGIWDTLSACKSRIFEMVWSPSTSAGLKLAALKFMQRVILVQTRGVSDPRLQKPNDPNLSLCPADHPFISASQLEAEGQKLMEGVITIFYTMPNPDMMAAVVNSWTLLIKQRPSQAHMIISAVASWHPSAIHHFSAMAVKSVEKTVRILLMHLSRTPQINSTFSHQINEALAQQAIRMDQAAANERNRKALELAESNRKRSIDALNDEANEVKRLKTDHPTASVSSVLANFDFSILPSALVTEFVVANLQFLSEQSLSAAIQQYRQANGIRAIPTAPRAHTLQKDAVMQPVIAPSEVPAIKAEPLDPLQMDMGDEEIDYEIEKLNEEIAPSEGIPIESAISGELIDVEEALRLVDFKLPPPRDATEEVRLRLMKSSITRIWDSSKDLRTVLDQVSHQPSQGALSQDLWILLIVRLVTRAFFIGENEEKDNKGEGSMEVGSQSRHERMRQTLFDYVMTDFPARERLAIAWMNEEWYNDRVRRSWDPNWYDNYSIWAHKIVLAYEPTIDAKDRTFTRFLLDIPQVPQEVLRMLRDLCVEPDRMQVGFTTLREFVSQRAPLRSQAMKILLDLTTHHERVTRGAAINTVKRWVPDIQPMGDIIRNFALRLLRRLQMRPVVDMRAIPIADLQTDKEMRTDETSEIMENGEIPQEEIIQTEYLPEHLELPAQKSQVLQHVELVFALCVKCPEFLDEIFDAYSQMEGTVQEAIQDLITALIRSLGPSHGRLQNLMRTFLAGAESLVLRILAIFTENGRPSPPLVALVKQLISERELDPRFLIPIIAEMDKNDIIKHLPRIVSMLNGTPEMKQLVRNVFDSIVTTPPQTFGSVTSNLPRVRQSELLTPAELMVLLHESEKEIGLKSAIEAIGICFSMTDVFRSEILAVVMQQIVDEPVLPVLFLRTVIQAVTTYKSLVGFVSTTLLSRLITKKIWTNLPLWEGFIRCAKTIAPASFGALLQLPKDQLRELVDKQPGLKAGLREFVLKKAGNKARQAGFLDLFGDDQTPVAMEGVASQIQSQAQ